MKPAHYFPQTTKKKKSKINCVAVDDYRDFEPWPMLSVAPAHFFPQTTQKKKKSTKRIVLQSMNMTTLNQAHFVGEASTFLSTNNPKKK